MNGFKCPSPGGRGKGRGKVRDFHPHLNPPPSPLKTGSSTRGRRYILSPYDAPPGRAGSFTVYLRIILRSGSYLRGKQRKRNKMHIQGEDNEGRI